MSFRAGQDAALAAFGVKEALHAMDRLQERTNLDPNVIGTLQAQADTLDLPEGHYYMPLKSPSGSHAGFAAFKTVPAWPKPKLVLATILGPEMHPKGSNIAHLMNPSHSQDTTHQDPDLTKVSSTMTAAQLMDHFRDLAKQHNFPSFFAVAGKGNDGASTFSSPKDMGDTAARNAREAHVEWEKKHDIDPDHDRRKHADFDTDAYNAELSPQQRAALRRRFDYFTHTLRNRGVETGTAHKRILIPKDKLTENDILGLGFEPVTIAIPEAGQDQFASYRHPDNTFHIHSHPEGWTMHEDRHPASTMIAKHEPTVLGKAKALVQGMPHLVTEGIPGLGYYLKGQLGGTQSTAQNILEDIDPDVRRRLERLKPSPTYEEKAAMDKNAFGEGQQAALSQYGVTPEGWVPEDEQGQDQPQQPLLRRRPKPQPTKTHTPWWPAALAAAAAGAGMYKYMRTPTFAKNNPYLARLQQHGAQHGFHEIVDVSRLSPEKARWEPNEELGRLGNAADWLNHHMRPQVNQEGQLDAWNKFKLWARYGGDAIPVASRRVGGKDQLWIPGQEGPANVKGVVFGRHSTPEYSETTPYRSIVRGGRDLEGSPKTLKAHTNLDLGGKHKEYLHWNKYSPGFMPETKGDMTSFLPKRHERLMQSPEGRVQAIREMQKNMREGFGRKGEDFIIKPDLGLQSGGELPWASENWGSMLRDYERHMAKPENRQAYQDALRQSDVAGVHYLRENNIFEGHVLNHMLRNPRTGVVAQREIPNYNRAHEYRVHVINGEVPKSLITPRHVFETNENIGGNYLGLPMGDVDYSQLQQLAQQHVNKLPAHERQGIFGLDMHFDPETGAAHLVESNPVQMATRRNGQYVPGGTSGFLDSNELPWASHVLHRHATGRHTAPVALGAAGLAAGGAGLGARLLTPAVADDENQDTPHPAG